MRARRPTFLLAVTALLLLGGGGLKAAEATVEDFPLNKGTYWIYQGEVRWLEPQTQEEKETLLTWKMEIVERIERGGVVAAVVKGHPLDAAFYETGRQRGRYLIVRPWPGQYFLVRDESVEEVLNRLADENDPLEGLVRDSELFLDLPLEEGKVFGEEEMKKRADLFYQWVVEEERPVRLEGVKSLPPASVTQYKLTYRTIGSHQFVYFVPGLGLTRYLYGHHGSLSQADLKLIEYHAAE